MKQLILLCSLSLSLAVSGCGLFSKTVDPITKERVYKNLREIFEEIISRGPKDPWDPKGEFETTKEYEQRLFKQQVKYYVEAKSYYEEVESRTFILLHKIDELVEFDADAGYFEIPYQISSSELNIISERIGPDFRLLIPPGVIERVHLFNEDLFTGNGWFSSKNGGFSQLAFFASANTQQARKIREAAESLNIFVRMEIQFEFPEIYQGYRFLPGRYEAYEEEGTRLSPYVEELKKQDLDYGADEGVITVKIVSLELVDESGVIYHRWPKSLSPAQTPTVSPTKTPTPFPTPVLPLPPTAEVLPSPTEQPFEQTEEAPFCPKAPAPRVEVGQRARVTYGDPRRLIVRVLPTTSSAILRHLELGEEFLVIGGPVCADNYIWWQIEFGEYSGYWVAEGEEGNYYIEPLD